MANIATKRTEQLERVEKYPPLEDDPKPGEHGILLSDQITYFATHHHMIEPFNERNLKPAGYELTVGDEYFMSGEFLELTDCLTILPFEVAVLKTGEILRLPRFMIARWNIRVTHAYAGLLWVGGPQVDPGYVGHLFCPIYNLSDKPVTLSRGETLALMDFQRTTPFDKRKTNAELKRYDFPPKRLILQDYDIRDFQSALFTRAGRKIDEFEDSIRTLETRFITFTQISFAMFAIFLTLLTIYTKVGLNLVETSASLVGSALVALSIMTFLMAGFTHLQYRLSRLVPDRYGAMMSKRALEARRFLRFYWLWGFFSMLMVSVAIGAITYRLVNPYFETMQREIVGTSTRPTIVQAGEVERRLVAAEMANQRAKNDIEALKSAIDALPKAPLATNK